MEIDFKDIAKQSLIHSKTLVPKWLPDGKWQGKEWVARNPTRPDTNKGSFKINSSTGYWSDFATNEKGRDLISLRALLEGSSQSDAAKTIAAELGLNLAVDHNQKVADKPKACSEGSFASSPLKHPDYGWPDQRWLYTDEDENPLFWIYRFDREGKKNILPVLVESGQLKYKGAPSPRPLYNLSLLKRYPDATVVVTEGEKAADAAGQMLAAPGFVVTTSSHGSQAASKTNWAPLSKRKVVIWPDADEPGAKYANDVALLIRKENPTANVAIIKLADFGSDKENGWDAADALAERWLPNDVKTIISATADSDPKPVLKQHSLFQVSFRNPGLRDGVYFYENGPDSGMAPVWICSPLEIKAQTNDGQGQGWGYLLQWKDPDGTTHNWPMPSEMLAGHGDEYRRVLLDRGLQIAPGTKTKNLLTSYIQTAITEHRVRCTDKVGWHGQAFVLPHTTLSATKECVLYQSNTIASHAFKRMGTLEEWRMAVAARAQGNNLLVFALSAAFAPSLLEAANEDSGGFHFRGESSSGKTTLLKVAASVWGSPDYLQRWRATTNGLEGLAQLHNDSLLILDELAQVDPKEAGEIAYMLGNGSGKVRSSREGFARKVARWRLLYLSAGEIGLADHVRAGGREVKAGQEIRLADILADAGKGLGAFEEIHGFESAASFARALSEATTQYYGAAGIAFLEYLTHNVASLHDRLIDHRKRFLREVLPAGAAGQVERVAMRFALIAFAGELATFLKITGWEQGEAESATRACFDTWLKGRGGNGNLETAKLLADVRALLEAHGESRFSRWNSPDTKTINRMGFIREINGDREYVVFAETFSRELCRGHDSRKAAQILLDLKILVPGPDGRPYRRESPPGMERIRCYVLSSNALWGD